MAADACPGYPETPCRVNLDLMPEPSAFWMYALTALAVAIFLYGFYEMTKVWRLGRPWARADWRIGLRRLVSGVASHRKFMQDRRPGTFHAWVFWGFFVLFLGTATVAVDADFFELILGKKLLFGTGYLWFEAILDFFGIVFLMGVGFLFLRRYRERPQQLHATGLPERPRWLPSVGGDLYALGFLFGIGLTGFVLEAMRLHVQISEGITYASWSFVGYALAWPLEGTDPAVVTSWYPWFWWLHFGLWTSVLAILPWTKFKHIVTASLNLFFHDPDRQSLPQLNKPFDLPSMLESGATDIPPVGIQTIRDLTWKDRLSLDACTNCGRCEAQCPAHLAGRPLSPRKLIQDLKAHMWADYRENGATDAKVPLTKDNALKVQIEEATLWSCTTCRACVTACPVDIEHVDMIVEMRRGLVMESRLDEHQQKLLVNLTNAGNPYGFPNSDRIDWRNGLPDGVKVETAGERVAKGAGVDLLWWVGCSGSFDPRNQEVTRAIATILNAAGVDFVVLGPEERCNGDPARRLGEEGRFQQSVMENLAVLQQYGVRRVLAQCPHCFNTLRNEYADFGADLEVIHHTEFIEQLIAAQDLPLRNGSELKITYHDSCYLMRHNGIGDAPRNVLAKANGLPVLEMAQNREQGLCCGAGGSNMWYEVSDEKERINIIRAKQAKETGADTVATACPFCLTMMSDGLSLSGNDGMAARDLAEIVVDHLDWSPPAVKEEATTTSDAPPDLGWGG